MDSVMGISAALAIQRILGVGNKPFVTNISGEVFITVEDHHCDWNNTTFHLENKNGKIKVEGEVKKEDSAKFSIKAITGLAFGILSIPEMEYLGWISNLSSENKEIDPAE